ncbi:MAG: hypothetical protein IKS32_10815 [Solobacterium sp.]|nr:hypothetical protein [Solobacterium sp.]
MHWFSADAGFVLSDALIALAVVSIMAFLVQSALYSAERSEAAVRNVYEESARAFEQQMSDIAECVCETALPEDETDEDDY